MTAATTNFRWTGDGSALVRYPLEEFDLPVAVASALGIDGNLAALRAEQPLSVRIRANDQALPWHALFYKRFDAIRDLYTRFVQHVAAFRMSGPYYYQAIPTLRVHLPGNLAVGEFHTDRQFGHPDGETTFWIPLTPAFDTNSLMVETSAGSEQYEAVVAEPGEAFVFDAGNLRHGNLINDTGQTRVSFDFRCLPVDRFESSEATTVNTHLRFEPGGYYAARALTAQRLGSSDD